MEKIKTNKSAIVSLCLGIASVFLWEFSIIPILAIVFGIIGLIRNEKKWNAIIGIVLGVVFIIVRISYGHVDWGFTNSSLSNNTQQSSTTFSPQTPQSSPSISYDPPTCSISFTPRVVELGSFVTSTYSRTGIITSISSKGTGDFSLTMNGNPVYGNALESQCTNPISTSYSGNVICSGSYTTQIKTLDKIGETSETDIITGPGGSSSCTASVTIIPRK